MAHRKLWRGVGAGRPARLENPHTLESLCYHWKHYRKQKMTIYFNFLLLTAYCSLLT